MGWGEFETTKADGGRSRRDLSELRRPDSDEDLGETV
jgi:hypothetical protein